MRSAPTSRGDRRHPEEPAAEVLDGLVDRRHDARDDHPGDVARREVAGGEEPEQQGGVFVRGALRQRLDAPVLNERLAVEDPELRVSVAHIDREQHRTRGRS
jgi:hypothetical protein